MDIDYKTACVYGITGSLGGGKTLTAVDIALEFLSRGHQVYSNIQLHNLKNDYQKLYTYNSDISSVNVATFPRGSPRGSKGNKRVAIIIDEAAEYFDQYTSSSLSTKNFLSWLRHSSKQGQFVFFIVQDASMLAKSLRLLIYRWIVCEDLGQYSIPMLRIRIPFMSNYVWRRVYDKQGNRVNRGFDTVSKFFIGRFYNTAQILSTSHQSLIDSSYTSSPLTIIPYLSAIKLTLFIQILLTAYYIYKMYQTAQAV